MNLNVFYKVMYPEAAGKWLVVVVIWVFAAHVKSVYSHSFSAEQFIRKYVVALVTLKHAERRVRAPYRRNDEEDQSVVTMSKELLFVALQKFCVRPTQQGRKVIQSGNPPPQRVHL